MCGKQSKPSDSMSCFKICNLKIWHSKLSYKAAHQSFQTKLYDLLNIISHSKTNEVQTEKDHRFQQEEWNQGEEANFRRSTNRSPLSTDSLSPAHQKLCPHGYSWVRGMKFSPLRRLAAVSGDWRRVAAFEICCQQGADLYASRICSLGL